jgi:predicted permease
VRRRKRMLDGLEQDIRDHIEKETQDNIERGMPPAEARIAAVRKFGNVTRVAEETRDVWSLMWMEQLWQDVRLGLRMLAKSPAFTVVALLSLALGIGANTAIFSVVNQALLHPIPYPDPDRVLVVWTTIPSQGIRQFASSIPDFLDWRAQNRAFQQMAAIQSGAANMTGIRRPERIQVFDASANIFSLFGMQPQWGRGFVADDERNGRRVVVLDYGFWQRSFGGDRNVVGKTIALDGENHTIIGILPKQFNSLGGDVWKPLVYSPALVNERGSHNELVVARLKPQVSLREAQSEMDTIAQRLERAFPKTNSGFGVNLMRLSELLAGDLRPALLVLFAAVGFVLLIACANVANLFLARATGRHREVAVRIALGGRRSRIIRQLLTESLLLSCLAGVAGFLFAVWGAGLLMKSLPESVRPTGIEISTLTGPVFAFTLSVSVLVGLLFGLAPAWQGSKFNLNQSLREGGRAGSMGAARQRLRNTLVVAEVALSLMLLVGAGLLVQSFLRLEKSNSGFRADGILTMELSLPAAGYATNEQQVVFFKRLLATLHALPGSSQAALVSSLPLQGHSGHNSFKIEGRPEAKSLKDLPIADKRLATADYFSLMGIPVLRGRAFAESDNETAPGVAIIDESTARQYWPNEDAVGKRIRYFKAHLEMGRWLTIVGVVGSVKQNRIEDPPNGSVYVPLFQTPDSEIALAVRGPVTAGALMDSIHALDRDLPVSKVRSMQDIVSEATALQRLAAQLVGIFALVALALAVIGAYGVIAYSVAQRTQEFGIRVALGASSPDLRKLVLRQALVLTGAGIAIGLIAAVNVTRLMSGILFEVRPGDPLVFSTAALILAAVAMLACYVPARRAARVDPMVALRYE